MSEGIDYILDQVGPDIIGSAYQPKRKKAVGGIDYILEQVTPDIMGVPGFSAMKTGNALGKYLYNNAEKLADSALGAVTQFDKGGSFGFGRKLGGVINAIGAAPIDALLTDKPFLQAFSDQYNEINDTALNSASRFENKHPAGAAGLQIGGAFVNPLNKIGAGYIAKGNGFANTLARSSLVGGETGVLAGLGRSETKDNIIRNVRDDALDGAVFGAAFPLAVKSAQMFGRQVFPLAKNKVQNIWNQNAGRQLDIKQAIANQENRYNNFLTENAEKEVFDAAPREFFNNLVPQSSFNPNVGISRVGAMDHVRKSARKIEKTVYENSDVLKKAQIGVLLNSNINKNLIRDYFGKDPQNIKTFNEIAAQKELSYDFPLKKIAKALKDNKLIVYSNSPIKNGVLVSPSKVKLREVVENGKFYSKEVPISDVAWSDGQKGFYAETRSGIGHFLGDDRSPFVRTLKNTFEYPDITFNQRNGKHYIKKYINNGSNKPFYDIIFENEEGDLYGKFVNNSVYLLNKFKEPIKDLSFYRRLPKAYRTEDNLVPLDKTSLMGKNIYRNGAIVNPKILNISTIERGLTDFQKKVFYEAMAQAVESSSEKVGSLGTTHIMQDTLGDMLKKSYKVSETGKKLPTAESLQLYELKTKLNELMKPSGIDKYEASLAKADALRSAYRQGYGFVLPSNTAGGLSFKSLRERQAFLQGRLANHLRKAKDGHDLAAKIAADKETFRSLMPQRNYDNLMREIAKINAGAGDNLYNWVPYLVQILGE